MVKKTRPGLCSFPNASAGEPLLEIKELTFLGMELKIELVTENKEGYVSWTPALLEYDSDTMAGRCPQRFLSPDIHALCNPLLLSVGCT